MPNKEICPPRYSLKNVGKNSASPQNISQFSIKCIFFHRIKFTYLKTMKLYRSG